MEPNQDNGNRISRKSFLRICGSVIAGGSILGVTGNLLWKMFTRPDDIFYGVDKKSTTINRSHVNNIVSPYRKVSAFKISDQIDAFDLYEGRLIVAAQNNMLRWMMIVFIFCILRGWKSMIWKADGYGIGRLAARSLIIVR